MKITKQEYDNAKRIILSYEKQELNLLKVELSKNKNTSIPKEHWGVHKSHCCSEHGCKYGYDDCPVYLGIIQQNYKCELCDSED